MGYCTNYPEIVYVQYCKGFIFKTILILIILVFSSPFTATYYYSQCSKTKSKMCFEMVQFSPKHHYVQCDKLRPLVSAEKS